MKKIFIACPTLGHGSCADYKRFIESVYKTCGLFASDVFLTIREDSDGDNRTPGTCLKIYFDEMETSDVILAFPEDSMEVAIELGWSAILKKRIILVLDRERSYSPLITGIGDITKTDCLFYAKEEVTIILSELKQLFEREY